MTDPQKALQDLFTQEIERISQEQEVDLAAAFLAWFVKTRLDLDIEDAFDATALDGTNDLGIDALFIDDDRRELHLFQSKYSDGATKVVVRSEVAAFIKSIKGLNSPVEGRKIVNRNLRRRIKDISGAFDKKFDIFAHFVVFGTFDASATTDFQRNAEGNVHFEKYDLASLLELFREDMTKKESAPADVTIPIVTGELAMRAGGTLPAVIVTIKGPDLARLEQRHGYALFQDNVRYYLTAKNRINRRISATIESLDGRQEFWYLNNGLSIVCRDFSLAKDKQSISLKEMQIVNGCQTTVTLSEAAREGGDLSGIEILAKIIKTTDQGIKDKITESTNSQSAVRLRDFRSNDAIQRRLQRDIKNKTYFYIRKRGEEEQVPKREGPRAIDMELAAQLILAFKLKQASEAKAKKGLLFSTEEGGLYSTIFSDDLDAEHIVFPFVLHKAVLKKKKEYRSKKRELVNEYTKLRDQLGEGNAKVQKLNSQIEENEFILHADLHYLALIARFMEKQYGELSPTDYQTIRTSQERDDLFGRLYDIATLHIRALIKQKLKDPDFTHVKFFKNPSATSEIFAQSDERMEEWTQMRPGNFFEGFPFPKLHKATART